MDIIHRPVFYLEHDVSETGFCLGRQAECTQLGSIDRYILCLRRQKPASKISCFKYKTGRWITSRISIDYYTIVVEL
jgi:hypothetical protein